MKQSVDLMKSRTEMNSMKRYSFRQADTTAYTAELDTPKRGLEPNHRLARVNSPFDLSKLKKPSELTQSPNRVNSRFLGGVLPASLIRRVMMLLVVVVMSVGSAWGQTFNNSGTMVSGGVEKDVYLNVLTERETTINYLQSKEDEIISLLNSFGSSWTSTNIADNIYVRWSILDAGGNIATNFAQNSTNQWGTDTNIGLSCSAGDISWNTSIAGFYWFKELEPWTSPHVLSSKLSVSTGVHNSKTFADFSDYTVVCYITDDLTGTTSALNAWTKGTLVTEPSFKVKYTFHLGVKEDTFKGSLKGTGQALSGGAVVGQADVLSDVSTASATLDLSAALAEVSGAKYARIYLIKDGEAVDPTGKLVTGGTAGPELEHGFYFSKPAGLTASDLSGVTLNLTAGEFESYQVMCVFSTDEATTLPTKEPDWDLQYTYTFEYPFKGDATSATKKENTFKLPASQWSTSPKEFSIDFDFTSSKILLKDKDNSVTLASIDFDKTWWDANYSGASVSGKNFYVRWFLKNKSTGVETYIANAIRNVNGASATKDCAKAQYGRFWSTKIGDGQTDLNNIMRIKIDGTPDSPGAEFSITDYDLVCTIGTSGDETLNGSNQVTMEPATLQMQYTFHFEDKPFEAENLSTVKTIYKAALYDASTGSITPKLFDPSVNAGVLSDVGKSSSAFFGSASYARWYVVEKGTGNIVANLTDEWGFDKLSSNAYTPAYRPKTGYGWTKYQMATSDDPTITIPTALRSNYKDFQVVCVVTTDMTGASYSAWGGGSAQYEFDCEPTTMQVKYVFNLILTETEFAAQPFAHYKGITGRDWVVPSGSTGSQEQKIWNPETGEAEDYTGDIRQGVHTWEYELYILPGEARTLILPFENYTSGGNNLEPRGYIRWYDWKTDSKVVDKTTDSSKKFTFTRVGTALNDAARGLFGLCFTGNPTHSTVGVTFTPDADFTESIDIACDVSKYSDGITTINGTSYLIHEPTLSNRYIFHIHPASEGATKLQASKTTLETAETAIKAGADNDAMHDLFVAKENTMFKLAEDKGKVVVSLGSKTESSFALRFDEHNLKNYILPDGSSGYVSADKAQWYAYFENDEGIWVKKINDSDTDSRIESFTFTKFTGSYNNLKGETGPSITDGKKFHVVGYVGNGTFDVKNGTGNYAPVVHYELHFIEAAPIPVTDLALPANLERTDAYMKYHYDLAGVVDFDGNPETNENVTGHEAEYYSTTNWSDAPTSAVDNMTYVPFPWDDNQYGFSYPPLTPTIKNGMDTGVSPEHGDYIILKSMNAPGISTHDNGSAYNYYWWKSDVLYDYTHTVTDNGKYGSFLYTDASNESRTIATIPFTADLCHGSSIYFTAAVANMTGNTIKPQLLIRIVGLKGGNRIGVVAFHTCDIISAGGADGQWNQIYGMSTIPVDFDDEITSFVAEVINYANDTNGADFAIDELKVFTNTSKVMLSQSGNTTCEDPTNGKLKIYMDAEGLQNVFGKSVTEQTIYWRICREDDGTVVTAPGMYPQYDGLGNKLTDDGSFTYGMSKVKSNFNPADDPTGDVKTEAARESDAYGWYKAADNTVYFQIAYQNFPGLEEGGRYYVSVFDPNESFDESKDSYWGGLHWGATSKCSIFSSFFVPRRQYVTYTTNAVGGTEGGAISVACGSAATVSDVQMILKVPNLNEATGFQSFKDLHYDYVFVPLTKWKSTTETFSHGGTDYKYEDLKTALATYRGASSTYKDYAYNDTDKGLASGFSSVNSTYYNLLSYAIEEGVLKLAYSTTFSHTFSGSDFTVTCLPVEQSVTVNSTATTVCSPFEVTFNLEGSSPELALGFSDVVYPVSGYEKRVLRIGLEQLNNLRNNGYKLHIPINNFRDKDKKTANAVNFDGDYFTLSAASSDGVNTTTGKKFAKIVNPDDNSATPFVDADHMYLELDLSGSNCEIETFYEGFEYEVSATYFDSRDAGDPSGRCEGDVYMLIKVVPEFVTWEPQLIETVGGVDYYNVNWNNDANWHRSTRAELYKDENVTGKTQNTATYGHPNGYDNNGEHSLASISLSAKNAFIPMRFSYVTLPSDLRAPSLVNMDIRAYAHSMEAHLGGTIQAGDMGTDRSPKDGGTSNATTYLRYDMLVRYPLVAGDDQDQCQGHLKADGTTVVGDGAAKTYDCEKFIGNSCREIYFKPRAEIINQQRLVDYQKAWVEKEVDRNKWYLMSAPLKGTYAGDMFVPATAITDYSLATPAPVTGRQVTEAFQPITFPDDVASTIYSRSNYPVYQRSWDHSEQGGKVYTETTDPRATDYTANLKYNGAVASTFAQWTHVFNDMSVKYNDLQGFALRAHKKDGAVGEKALFRWPKTNESYTYYNYADSKGTVTATTTKGDAVYGRLITDGYDNKATMTDIPLDAANVNTDNQYYLVGNPYMSSIDMVKFFAQNSALTGGYWKVDGGPTASLTTGQIKPMEAFFVKTADATTKIQFDNSMMIDGNAPVISAPAPAQRTQGLTLTAENENGRSEASVEIADEVKTVETLFDSNLEDVPMVYTVADGKAVSVNQLTALETLCFGVTCKGDEAVEVTLTGLDTMEGNLYVVDAVEGTSTAVAEGDAVEVMPNEYGRYFLTRSAMLGEMKDEAVNGFVVSVHGGMVTVSGAEALGRVRALSVSGAVMYDAVSSDTSIAFPLQQGTYVIEADGRKAVKILVK